MADDEVNQALINCLLKLAATHDLDLPEGNRWGLHSGITGIMSHLDLCFALDHAVVLDQGLFILLLKSTRCVFLLWLLSWDDTLGLNELCSIALRLGSCTKACTDSDAHKKCENVQNIALENHQGMHLRPASRNTLPHYYCSFAQHRYPGLYRLLAHPHSDARSLVRCLVKKSCSRLLCTFVF